MDLIIYCIDRTSKCTKTLQSSIVKLITIHSFCTSLQMSIFLFIYLFILYLSIYIFIYLFILFILFYFIYFYLFYYYYYYYYYLLGNIPGEVIRLWAKKTPLAFCSGVVSSAPKKWRLTRWPVDPSWAILRSTYIHPRSLAKIRQRTSEE